MQSYLKNRLLVCSILLFACNQNTKTNDVSDGLATFNADSLKQELSVLASDAFMGRKPFTEGETKTLDYLQKRFASIGLESGNGNSYLQEVPLVNIEANAALSMEINSAKNNFTLKAFDDYVVWTNKPDSIETFDKAELVFVGYGVVAPEYNWNDYEGMDVKGKVVLVMVNDPGFWVEDTTLFKGNTMTYYGRRTYKFEEAARQGAIGCLIIHNTRAASYPFSVLQNSFNTSRLQLDNRGKNKKECDMIGWITEPATNQLFTAAGFDSTLLIKANQPGFKAVPLNLQATTIMKVKATYDKSYNVIGVITGSKKPDEVLIYTAHWDHLGIGNPDASGDSIYNGAIDNASGAAGLLELARVFKSMKTPPERTVVFLSLTSEEHGLLGSQYYTENPIYPADKTVANINLDMMSPYGKTNDIVVVGEGQSELEDYLKEEIEKTGGYLSYESHTEAGLYYRSDHFNFAKIGVPAIFVESGIDIIGKDKAYGQKMADDYNAYDYHHPSDNYDPNWTMEGAIGDLKLLFLVGKRLAFSNTWPQWKPGSEFKPLREKKK